MRFAYPLHISFDGYVFIFVFDLQSSHDHHYSIGNPFRQLEHSNHVLEIRIYREALGHRSSHCLYVSQCYRTSGNINELWKVLKEISL